MSTIATSTLNQQKSFTGEWLVSGDTLTLPQGVITDLMISTNSTAPVYLGKLTVHDGTLFISFEQNGAIRAYGEIRGDSVTQALIVTEPIISATVTTGNLVGRADIDYSPTEAMVAPELVTSIGDMNEGVCTLTINQNGATTSYTLLDDMMLVTDNNLISSYNAGTVIIGVTDDGYQNFIRVAYPLNPGGTTQLTSINNVKAPSGAIRITISTAGAILPANSDGAIISIDGRGVNLCGPPRDLIDDKVSPTTHSSKVYKPLDDLYSEDDDGMLIRDTRRAVNWSYGLSEVALTTIDPNIDSTQAAGSESEG